MLPYVVLQGLGVGGLFEHPNKMGEMRCVYKTSVGTCEEKEYLEHLGVDETIILKLILKK
jgi:hypothetical protein